MTQTPRSAIRRGGPQPIRRTTNHAAIPQRAAAIKRQLDEEEAYIRSMARFRVQEEDVEYVDDDELNINQRRDGKPRATTKTRVPVVYVEQPSAHKRNTHPLVWIGLTAVCLVIALMLFNIISSFVTHVHDSYLYGQGLVATYRVRLQDGEAESCFLAWNNNGRPWIIFYKGCKSDQGAVYTVTEISADASAATAPVTLSFTDINGKGRKDMTVTMGQTFFVLWNIGDKFSSTQQGG